MSDVIIQPEDYKYIKDDSDFSPERNKAIIAQTIKETDKFFTELQEIRDNDAMQRIDVLSSYAHYRFNKGTKQFKDYVGRELYNGLVGEKILSKVRVMDSVNRLNRNDKFKKSILL